MYKCDLFLKEINGFMLNVTDQYCVSPAASKGGFSCHPGDLSRKFYLCHGSCKSQKRGTRPPSLQDSQKDEALKEFFRSKKENKRFEFREKSTLLKI